MSDTDSVPATQRSWIAELDLHFALRSNGTALKRNRHSGPLRVQRPFYPEGPVCHVYLLHPPGGLVLGDSLTVRARLDSGTHALLTTPSAGKVYGTQYRQPFQQQSIELNVADDAVAEWLPQETIVFSGANVQLKTILNLQANSRACVWDVVCLGRPAAQETFKEGRCEQVLEVRRENRLLLVERNRLLGGAEHLASPWGLGGANTFGTILATVRPAQDEIDALREQLHQFGAPPDHQWGVTQKDDLLIVRYLGQSARVCRNGFILVWQKFRPLLCAREAVIPRIWCT